MVGWLAVAYDSLGGSPGGAGTKSEHSVGALASDGPQTITGWTSRATGITPRRTGTAIATSAAGPQAPRSPGALLPWPGRLRPWWQPSFRTCMGQPGRQRSPPRRGAVAARLESKARTTTNEQARLPDPGTR